MRELSLHVLDIAQNSISAEASLIEISVLFTGDDLLTIVIRDNGRGMTPEQLERVRNPFFTTRTTRRVGMGIPLFFLSAEMTGGSAEIQSEQGVGTTVTARFRTDSVDFTPLGDMCSTIMTLVTMNTDTNFIYTLSLDDESFVFSTVRIKEILGEVAINAPEVTAWLRDYIIENENAILYSGGKYKREDT